MSRKSPAFSFYPDSFVMGCLSMNFEQRGLYIWMLCYQWSHGPSMLQAYAQACAPAMLKDVQAILDAKFETDGSVWWNARLEEERIKQQARQGKAEAAAARRWTGKTQGKTQSTKVEHASSICSGDAQASPPSMPQAYAPAMHSDSVSDSVSVLVSDSGSGSGSSQASACVDIDHSDKSASEETGPQRIDYPADFMAFWDAYPKKVGKYAAFKVWKRLGSVATAEEITAAAKVYARSGVVRDGYAANATTWLNRHSWEDDPAAWDRPSPQTAGERRQQNNSDLLDRVFGSDDDGSQRTIAGLIRDV